MTAATPDRREPIRSPAWFAAAVAAVFAVAVAVRLGSLLRGGGLYGLGNYDDGVHFAAAVGLINGLLPYRDFLLLHPPGVVLALAPFAWLSWAIGEPDAMAVARLSWILLGGVNAALCALVIRPIGRLAAVFAGLVYALMLGAVYVEHTTLLEPPATTLLLLALVITRLLGSDSGITTRHYVIAGLLLGLSPVLKIWGVLAVLVVVGGIVGRRGLRSGLMTLAAAVGSCAAVCLPFFLAAPDQMWRMVVVAQLGRRRAPGSLVRRLDDITGISRWSTGVPQWTALLVVVLALLLVAFVICLIRAELRLVAALLVSHLAIVLSTPMWFLHYAGLSAAPIALTLGGALGAVMTWTRSIRWLPGVLATAAILATLLLAYPLTILSLGNKAFPGKTLAAAIADEPGCVTTDMPITLIQMDLLQRDIDRGCRFVVDLGGYSYYEVDSDYHEDSRRKNKDWQQIALAYYRSGNAAIVVRFDTDSGFSKKTARTIANWPVIAASGQYQIHRPEPATN